MSRPSRSVAASRAKGEISRIGLDRILPSPRAQRRDSKREPYRATNDFVITLLFLLFYLAAHSQVSLHAQNSAIFACFARVRDRPIGSRNPTDILSASYEDGNRPWMCGRSPVRSAPKSAAWIERSG
jgi:hypothetical protein